jgi:hypothetical protein
MHLAYGYCKWSQWALLALHNTNSLTRVRQKEAVRLTTLCPPSDLAFVGQSRGAVEGCLVRSAALEKSKSV